MNPFVSMMILKNVLAMLIIVAICRDDDV